MKKIKILFWICALLFPVIVKSQTIVKGAGVFYTNGIPTVDPPLCDGSEVAININGGWWYEYSRDSLKWIHAGFRIQKLPGCVAPTEIPGDKESEIVLNDCDSLYRFRGGSWYLLNKYSVGSWTLTDGVDSENLGGQTLTVTGAGIAVADYVPATNTLTITATEVDGSVSNEGSLTVVAGGSNDSEISSNTSGSSNVVIAGGANITITESGNTITIAATSGTGTDLTFTGTSSPVTLNSSTGTDVTFTAGGIVTFSATSGNITITGTEVDGSVSNEGSLTVGAGGSNDSEITSNTSGSSAVTILGGANVTITESGNTITIAASTGGGADLTFTGASSPVTLNSSTGPDVTFTAGGILSFSATSTNITMTATEVDGSVSNEGSLTVGAGGANTSTISSNTSGSTDVTIAGGANVTVTEVGNTITIAAAAEVDGSVTNEGLLGVGAGGATSSVFTSYT